MTVTEPLGYLPGRGLPTEEERAGLERLMRDLWAVRPEATPQEGGSRAPRQPPGMP